MAEAFLLRPELARVFPGCDLPSGARPKQECFGHMDPNRQTDDSQALLTRGIMNPWTLSSFRTSPSRSVWDSSSGWWQSEGSAATMPEQGNPSELKPAIVFGILYAVVLFASAAVRARFGGNALYAVAAISGLTDVDAITLSTARLVSGAKLDVDRAWRLIILANACNLVFKAGTVALLGSRRMAATIASLFAVAIAASALLLFLWP